MLRLNRKSEPVSEPISSEFKYKMTITSPALYLWDNLSSLMDFPSELLYTSSRDSVVSFAHGKHIVKFDSDTKAVILDSSISNTDITIFVWSHNRQMCSDFIRLLYELHDDKSITTPSLQEKTVDNYKLQFDTQQSGQIPDCQTPLLTSHC